MLTDQPVKQLVLLRHEDKRLPIATRDNNVDADQDRGEAIDFHMRFLDNTGPVNVAHAERVRAAAANRLSTGRVADFAAQVAAEEYADRYGEVPPATMNPWGNEPVPPFAGVPRQAPVQPGAQPIPLLGAQLATQAGSLPGRWANQMLNPANPAYALPPVPPPQPPVWWAAPSMPSAATYVPAGAPLPGVGLQPPVELNPFLMGIEQFNPFASLLPPQALLAPPAPTQNTPLGYAPVPGAVQPLPPAPAQTGGAANFGFSLAPPVTHGARVPRPAWAPAPSWSWRDSVADLADQVSSMLRR